jgi:sugar lactone lactonase YvrE
MKKLYTDTILDTPRFSLGECPTWIQASNTLFWIDITEKKLLSFELSSQIFHSASLPQEPGCIAPIADHSLLIAMRDGIYSFNIEKKILTQLITAPYDVHIERFNDGKCDAMGRLWVGTVFEPKTSNNAGLYCFQSGPMGYQMQLMASDNMTANGLAFDSKNQLMYWSNTPAHQINQFDLNLDTGQIANRRPFKIFNPMRPPDIYEGRPDGACIDADNCYWVAMYGGSKVIRLSPQAEILTEINLPCQFPTMVCLGGFDFKTLLITTASKSLNTEQLQEAPLSGHVFQIPVDTPGLAINGFKTW